MISKQNVYIRCTLFERVNCKDWNREFNKPELIQTYEKTRIGKIKNIRRRILRMFLKIMDISQSEFFLKKEVCRPHE